jgi:hypothetical protein
VNDARRRLALAVAGGLALFALGAALAFACLPEWRSGRPAEPALYARALRRIAVQAGLPPARVRGEVELTRGLEIENAGRVLGRTAASWLAATRQGIRVAVRQEVEIDPRNALYPALHDRRAPQALEGELALDGRPWMLIWESPNTPIFQSTDRAPFERLGESFTRALLRPGEELGTPVRGSVAGGAPAWQARNLTAAATQPPQNVLVVLAAPQSVLARRQAGWIGAPGTRPSDTFNRRLLSGLAWLPLALAVLGLFLTLVLRARIDLVNGALLGLLALLGAGPRWLFELLPVHSWFEVVNWGFAAPGRALAIVLTWSAGESLLRAVQPDFTTSLDTLRHGRLGPRGGRALLAGLAGGAALAGLALAVGSLAAVLPGVSPAGTSVRLPLFRLDGSPVLDGIWLAAGVTLALALAVRFLPPRAAPWGAALLAGYALGPLQLFPYPCELAANVALAGGLVWIARRFGLTALLAGSATYFLLPGGLAAALYLAWMPGAFALTATVTAGIAGLGFLGLGRPEAVETEAIPPPPFMRRLADARRVRHEVDLLARMQVGLLPREMPRLPGYQVTARSVLATEAGGDLYDFLPDDAGRLWLAAGDVAGHGYSCAVAQAMVKAGLQSLVEPEETPAGVLRRLDRVLRGVSLGHSFTSLSLIRLDPGTGDALLANAGNPYPLLFAGTQVTEIELPGLPLARGPVQPYADRPFNLPPGGVLLLCSDGLYEALDGDGNAYGYERAREVLRAMGHRPAVEIVDALLNDCRRHLGAEQAPDDVTVVVVRRG